MVAPGNRRRGRVGRRQGVTRRAVRTVELHHVSSQLAEGEGIIDGRERGEARFTDAIEQRHPVSVAMTSGWHRQKTASRWQYCGAVSMISGKMAAACVRLA